MEERCVHALPSTVDHPKSYKHMWFHDPRDAKYRHFKRVPFGARLAPAWASVVSSELCQVLRARGVDRVNAFVGDIIVIADSESACAQHLNTVLSVCAELGLPVSSEEVQRPSQVQTYLGIEIDSVACELRATRENFQFTLDEIRPLLAADRTRVLNSTLCAVVCRGFRNSYVALSPTSDCLAAHLWGRGCGLGPVIHR